MIIFYSLMSFYFILFGVRLFLSFCYWRNHREGEEGVEETNFTVVQPILSGDPRLEDDLWANLVTSKELQFCWLVDKTDVEAQRIVDKILERCENPQRISYILCDPVPQSMNPKVFKLQIALNHLSTPYMIILDDDSVMDMSDLSAYPWQKLPEAFLLTGLPYNQETGHFWSRLLAAFVNGNAIITYPTMAQLGQNHSINGMFYILPTKIARQYEVFEAIATDLCDDLALAQYFISKGIPIYQSFLTCYVRTSIKDAAHYVRQMKRWLLFSFIYIRRHMSLSLLSFIVFPGFLPLIMMISALSLGTEYVLLVLAALLVKAVLLQKVRYKMVFFQESKSSVFYEVMGDLALPLLSLYVLLGKPTIQWRDKMIRITDGKIHYE